jgi:hypothetical protein
MVRSCRNPQCDDAVTVRCDREGLIHVNGKYICRKKNKDVLTAAE